MTARAAEVPGEEVEPWDATRAAYVEELGSADVIRYGEIAVDFPFAVGRDLVGTVGEAGPGATGFPTAPW